ncbi:MAG TPA: hypothetical protein VF898_03250 [Chloroflexota bacterium]
MLLLSTVRVDASNREHTISAAALIREVAAVYGEHKPQVVTLQRTITDSTPNQRMYFVELRGHFRKGKLTARYLLFSALAKRWYVWGVVGENGQHHPVWIVDVLPRPNSS